MELSTQQIRDFFADNPFVYLKQGSHKYQLRPDSDFKNSPGNVRPPVPFAEVAIALLNEMGPFTQDVYWDTLLERWHDKSPAWYQALIDSTDEYHAVKARCFNSVYQWVMQTVYCMAILHDNGGFKPSVFSLIDNVYGKVSCLVRPENGPPFRIRVTNIEQDHAAERIKADRRGIAGPEVEVIRIPKRERSTGNFRYPSPIDMINVFDRAGVPMNAPREEDAFNMAFQL